MKKLILSLCFIVFLSFPKQILASCSWINIKTTIVSGETIPITVGALPSDQDVVYFLYYKINSCTRGAFATDPQYLGSAIKGLGATSVSFQFTPSGNCSYTLFLMDTRNNPSPATSVCSLDLSSIITVRTPPASVPGGGIPRPFDWLPFMQSPSGVISNVGLEFVTQNVAPFVITLLIFLVIILSLVFLIWGGIAWIMSSGNKEGLAKARLTVTHALIGLALGLGSFVIIRVFFGIFGVTL